MQLDGKKGEQVESALRILTDSFSQHKDTHSWGRALGRSKDSLPAYMRLYMPAQAAQTVPGTQKECKDVIVIRCYWNVR